MPRAILKCRICGKEYEACLSETYKGVFRWQEVACSPECGAEYLRKIQISRGLLVEEDTKKDDVVVNNPRNDTPDSVLYNEDYYGFDGEPDDEYEDSFGF